MHLSDIFLQIIYADFRHQIGRRQIETRKIQALEIIGIPALAYALLLFAETVGANFLNIGKCSNFLNIL